MQNLLATFIFLSFIGSACFDIKSNDQNMAVEVECDTLFPFAIHLIEKDSFLMIRDASGLAPDIYASRRFTYVDFVGDSLYEGRYGFINQYHDSIEENESTLKEHGLDKIFSVTDLNKYKNESNQIEVSCFPQFRFLSGEEVNAKFDNIDSDTLRIERYRFYSFSKPILSQDNKYLLIQMDEHCYGFCGQGVTFVFEKKNNKWTKYKEIGRWIS